MSMPPAPESGRARQPVRLCRRLIAVFTVVLLSAGSLAAVPGQASAHVSLPLPAADSAADQLAYAAVGGAFGTPDALAVMDTATGSIVDYETLPQVLTGVAVNPAGTELYGTTAQSAVVVIDPATDATLGTIAVGGAGNRAVAFNASGTQAYVADQEAVDVVDTATRTATATIPVDGYDVATNPARPLLYTISSAGTLSVVDTDTNTVVASVPCGSAGRAVAVDGDGSRVYALAGQNLCVLDATTNSLISTIAVPVVQYSIPFDVSVNAAGTLAAVVGSGPTSRTFIIDLQTGSVSSSFAYTYGAAGVLNAAGTRLYAATYGPVMDPRGSVSVFDTGTGRSVGGFGFAGRAENIALGPIASGTTTALAVSPSSSVTQASPVTLTATVSGAASGTVQFYNRGDFAAGPVPLGAPVPVTNGTATLSTTALPQGTDTLSAAFTPSQPGLLRSASAPASLQVLPQGVHIDQQTSRIGTGTVTTPPLSTLGPRLLLAFTSSDGPAAKQTTTVTGAGLNWTLVRRANGQRGTAEIWSAFASGPLTDATVTSSPQITGYDQQVTVVALSGAAGVGASVAAGRSSGTESVSVTTTAPGSQVFGVGEDYNGAIGRTVGSGQYLLGQWVDSGAGDTFWAQTTYGPTSAAGTSVTMNVTAPTGDIWNMAGVEVLALGP